MKPSYWELTSTYAPADLVVIGGGITGASMAYYYKKAHPSERVVILEKGALPSGATTRNAGFACFGSVSELLADMEISSSDRVGEKVARRIRGLRRLREELGDEAIGYEACGGAEIFTDSKTFERSAKAVEEVNRLVERHTGFKNAFRVGEFEGYPAIFCAEEGAIHSGRMMQALHQKAMALGVEYLPGMAVEGIEVSGEENNAQKARVHVKLADATITARRVAVATNGFASKLLDIAVQPARGQIIVSKPLEKMPWKGVFHYNEGYVYFRHVKGEDGELRLLLGGARDVDPEGETTYEEGQNPQIREWLLNFAEEVLRIPLREEIDLEWSGFMGFTPEKEPLLKLLNPQTLVVTGLSGIGVSIGFEVAYEALENAGWLR